MRWPWQRPRCGDDARDRVDQAIETTEAQHREVMAQGEEVDEIAQAHRDMRERNHFAEAFARALGGNK